MRTIRAELTVLDPEFPDCGVYALRLLDEADIRVSGYDNVLTNFLLTDVIGTMGVYADCFLEGFHVNSIDPEVSDGTLKFAIHNDRSMRSCLPIGTIIALVWFKK